MTGLKEVISEDLITRSRGSEIQRSESMYSDEVVCISMMMMQTIHIYYMMYITIH
jgi:hypothetical protein